MEQTNSSVILGERLILKAYRRLQQGYEPGPGDRALPDRGGALREHAAARRGRRVRWARRRDDHPRPLAGLRGEPGRRLVLRPRLPRPLPRGSPRDLVEPRGRGGRGGGAGGAGGEDAFFASLVRTLGLRTGELHAAFAAPTDDPAFAPEPASPEEVAGWAEGILAESRRTLELLKRRRGKLPEEAGPDADRLLGLRRELTRRIKDVSREGFGVVKTRHHGDYHLGQVLVVGQRLPDHRLRGRAGPAPRRAAQEALSSARRGRDAPLVQLRHPVGAHGPRRRARRADREPRAVGPSSGSNARRQAFLEGYAEGARGAASYPENEEHARTLDRTLHAREGSVRDPLRAGQSPGLGRHPHQGRPRPSGRAERGGGILRHEDAVASVVAGDHPDPFSFLGMHPEEDGGFVVRAFLPGASTVEVVSYGGDVLGELERIHPEGLFAGPVARERAIPPAGRVGGWRRGRDRRPLPVPRRARRAGPLPLRRGQPPQALREARCAPDGARRRRRHELRRLGPERPARLGDRGLQLLGRTQARYAQASSGRGVGDLHPGGGRGRRLQV